MNLRTLHKRGAQAARQRKPKFRTVAIMVPLGGKIPQRIPKRARLLLGVYPISVDPALPGAEQTVSVTFNYDGYHASKEAVPMDSPLVTIATEQQARQLSGSVEQHLRNWIQHVKGPAP